MAPLGTGSGRIAVSAAGGKKRTRSKLAVNLVGLSDQNQYKDAAGDVVTPALHDEELDSEEDDFRGDTASDSEGEVATEEEEETVDAKRLRLAREYLNKIEAQESSHDDESESDNHESDGEGGVSLDKIGKRIAKDRLRKSGLLQSRVSNSILEGMETMRGNIARKTGISSASKGWMGGEEGCGVSAEKYAKSWLDERYVTYHRGHNLTPTAVALSHDGQTAFSGAKDGSLIMWNVEEEKKTLVILPAIKHGVNIRSQREILAIETSADNRYMAVGGRDNCVRVFDIRMFGKANPSSPVAKLEGHKKSVTSLAFRSRTLDLYSGSEDRCIRRYDLNAMTYVETLYGHQSPIVGMDCANKNRPVSIARDRTIRVWKVEEDSHLVFRPGGNVGSAECVSAIQDGWFATGHDDGRLALWREEKKRPVGDVIFASHGYHSGLKAVARSVMCSNALVLSDVLATGSSDGYLRLWKVSTAEEDAGIKPLDSVPLYGYINSIAIGPGGKFCVAAIGQEPRLGRWDRVPRAKNRFAIIRLNGQPVAGS